MRPSDAAFADPRVIKRRERAFRREILAVLRPRWRRCFWTWPLGHEYPRWVTTSPPRNVTKCRHCAKPYMLDGFTGYDLLRLIENTYNRRDYGITDEQYDALDELRRAS